MGIVYLCEQRHPVRRRVALKLVKPGMDTKEVLARFEVEQQALALLSHPNIARVYDSGASEDGRPYFVMEYFPGLPIDEYCERHKLTLRQRLELFVQACNGAEHAHRRGIIHRDLKPSNILVCAEEGGAVAKIIDFGVAKATNQRLTEKTLYTRLGHAVGTPMYMSPEQAEKSAEEIDYRSDVYSLGVILYDLLVGEPPFDWEALRKAALEEILRRIRDDDPPTPSTRWTLLNRARTTELAARRQSDPLTYGRELRGELDWITMKAMEKERDRRYPSASELAADVLRHLRAESVAAGPPSPIYRVRRYVRKNRGPVAAAGAVVAALALGFVVSLSFLFVASAERDKARAAEETAREEERKAEREEYAARLLAAQYACDVGESAIAKQTLEDCAPSERRWEWDHLMGRLSLFRERARLGELPGFEGTSRPVALSPNLRSLAYWTEAGVRLWDLDGRKALATLRRGPPDPLAEKPQGGGTAIAFSLDGTRLALGDANGWLAVWGLETSEILADLPAGPATATAVTFVGGNDTVVMGFSDGSIRVWTRLGGLGLIAKNHDKRVAALSANPDGSLLASAGFDGTAILWRREGNALSRKRLLVRPPSQTQRPESKLYSVAFSPDGTLIAVGADDFKIWLWSAEDSPEDPAEDGGFLQALSGHTQRVEALAFVPPDRLVSGSWDRALRVWERSRSLAGGSQAGIWEPRATLLGHKGNVLSIGVCSATQRIATLSDDGTLKEWPLEAGEGHRTLRGVPSGVQVRCLGFSLDDRHLAAGDDSGELHVWDLTTGKHLRTDDGVASTASASRASPVPPAIDAVRWGNRSANRLIAAGGRCVADWRLGPSAAGGRASLHMRCPLPESAYVLSMDLSPDDQRCVIGTTGGFVSLWMLDSNELSEVARLGSEGAPVAVTGLAFHPDGKHIVSASSDRTLRVWRSDGKTMTLSQTVSTAQGETLNCIALSPDGMRLVAAFKSDRESTLGFWTWTEDKQSYGRPARVACAGTVQDVSFSCFGDRVAAGSRDRSIHVFDVEPARPLLSIKGHRTAVNAIAWSHDGERLASGDVDSEVRVWETRESQSWAWSQRDN